MLPRPLPSSALPHQVEEHISRIREELDREREERNYFQLERDKIHTFWEITRRQLEEKKAELRNKDREMEEAEERHQVEIKVSGATAEMLGWAGALPLLARGTFVCVLYTGTWRYFFIKVHACAGVCAGVYACSERVCSECVCRYVLCSECVCAGMCCMCMCAGMPVQLSVCVQVSRWYSSCS